MDRLGAMAVFTRVVERGSFSAAAKDLGLGQPAISKAIAALEANLGVRLLVRTTRGLTPTDAGLAYAERARRILDEADEADALARGNGKELSGRLRFAAPVTFARLHIIPYLADFLQAHPALTLDAILDDRAVDLVGEGIDVAFRLGEMADSSLIARKMSASPRHVFASPAYLARRGRPQSPADLLSHDIITYSATADAEVWRFKQGASELSINVPKRMSVSAAEGVRAAVLGGMGLALGSDWMFAPELATGQIVPVLEAWSLSPTTLWAAFPAGRLQSVRAQVFADYVKESLSRTTQTA